MPKYTKFCIIILSYVALLTQGSCPWLIQGQLQRLIPFKIVGVFLQKIDFTYQSNGPILFSTMEFFADYGWLFGLSFCSHYAQENTFSSIVKLELNILERFVPNVV